MDLLKSRNGEMDDSLIFEIDDSNHGNRCCVPSILSNGQVDVANDDTPLPSDDLKEEVGSNHLVVQNICKYLDRRDLRNALFINAVWNEVATREFKHRISPGWISYSKRSRFNLQVSRSFLRTNGQLCIVACDADHIKWKKKKICLHDEDNAYMRLTFAEYVEQEIVPSCTNYLLIRCSALNSQHRDLKEVFRAVLLPQIPDIRIVQISCNPTDDPQTIHDSLRPDEDIKCVFLLSPRYSRGRMDQFLSELFRNVGTTCGIALGGGLIKSAQFSPINEDELHHNPAINMIHCVAFVQESGVRADFNAHSTIVNSQDAFEGELIKFKSCCTLRTHGVVFRMCCYAKQNKEIEHDLLGVHFPDYAVFSLEVDGELGWDSSSNKDPTCLKLHTNKRQKISFPDVWHSWSTILVLVTWGNVRIS